MHCCGTSKFPTAIAIMTVIFFWHFKVGELIAVVFTTLTFCYRHFLVYFPLNSLYTWQTGCNWSNHIDNWSKTNFCHFCHWFAYAAQFSLFLYSCNNFITHCFSMVCLVPQHLHFALIYMTCIFYMLTNFIAQLLETPCCPWSILRCLHEDLTLSYKSTMFFDKW